jgi:hypothetical protein
MEGMLAGARQQEQEDLAAKAKKPVASN